MRFLIILFLFFCPPVYAQECTTTWCDAPWPPAEGTDRTIGKDNCGKVCIKIVREVEKIVEVEKIIEKKAICDKEGITVVLTTNEKGEPAMTASCSKVGTTIWDYRIEAIKLGRKEKLVTKNGLVYTIFK